MRRVAYALGLALVLGTVVRPAPVAAQATPTTPQSATAQAQNSAEQRKALLELRAQLQVLTRQLNDILKTMGPGPAMPRERPAMIECPWPQPSLAAVVSPEVPGVPGTTDPPRPRIPDCAPPGWKAPAELTPYNPRPLPTDRPKPIVEDYLKYVVTAPTPEIVARFNLDTTYYKKYADANGYPILASAKVPDAALAIVRDQVNYMLGHRPDVRDEMIVRGARIVIMAETEYTVDIPEQRNWTVPKYLDPRLTEGERARYYEPGGLGSMSPGGYWNGRARGMGGTLTSCAEENVLGYYNTRYWGTNICVHEFSHGIMGAGIGNADPQWFQDIVDAYKAAKAACHTDGRPALPTARGYGGNTFNEYWATGVEAYVGNGGSHRRAELKATDPRLYELITRLIPEDRHLPVRANVANRTRPELAEYVQQRNPEWWQREQQRQQAAAQNRGGGQPGAAGGNAPTRAGGGGGAAPQTCTPRAN